MLHTASAISDSVSGSDRAMRMNLRTLLLLGTMAVASATADAAAEPGAPARKGYAAGTKAGNMHRTIYKGKYARSRDFPFQVYIRVFLDDGNKEYCGGSIIGPFHILTAAHCVKMSNVSKVCTIAGNENRFHPQALKFTVVRQHFYPKKKDERVEADIAVFMVDRPMPVGKSVHIIRLQPKAEVRDNTTCSISGWGRTDDELDDADLLKHAKVLLVPPELCRKSYPKEPPADLLCAGFYETGGADACKGDSGGPLVCNGRLLGVVKGGKGCGLPNYPGTYTDVRYYWHWIKNIIAEDMKNTTHGTKYENKC